MATSPKPCFLAAILLACSRASIVNISNREAKRDVEGRLMDVHDGAIMQWKAGGLFYWYGMGYQNCTETIGIIPPVNCPGMYKPFGGCGFRDDHAVNVYSSPDLASWTFERTALPIELRPTGIYFRPKVIFNRQNNEYVLWINYLPPAPTPLKAYPNATYLVATSKTPTGPFIVVNEEASIAVKGGGDLAVFVDPKDQVGYLAYDAWGKSEFGDHQVSIEKLTPDYHDTLGAAASTGPISPKNNEAPILFERQGLYYLLFGNTCCFCSGGANSQVWVASAPMGPWNNTGVDINPKKRIHAQENFVIQAQGDRSRFPRAQGDRAVNGSTGGATETEALYIYTGDLWTSAADTLKSHDLQFWAPLRFNGSNIAPMEWVDSFEIDVGR
jgi:hypothetical protein